MTSARSECAACSAELPAEARFCFSCGLPVAAPSCSTRGAALVAGARFCMGCGTPPATGLGSARPGREPPGDQPPLRRPGRVHQPVREQGPDGAAAVSRDGQPIRELGPDDYFGEISIIDGKPRSVSVEARPP